MSASQDQTNQQFRYFCFQTPETTHVSLTQIHAVMYVPIGTKHKHFRIFEGFFFFLSGLIEHRCVSSVRFNRLHCKISHFSSSGDNWLRITLKRKEKGEREYITHTLTDAPDVLSPKISLHLLSGRVQWTQQGLSTKEFWWCADSILHRLQDSNHKNTHKKEIKHSCG